MRSLHVQCAGIWHITTLRPQWIIIVRYLTSGQYICALWGQTTQARIITGEWYSINVSKHLILSHGHLLLFLLLAIHSRHCASNGFWAATLLVMVQCAIFVHDHKNRATSSTMLRAVISPCPMRYQHFCARVRFHFFSFVVVWHRCSEFKHCLNHRSIQKKLVRKHSV